MAKSHLSERGIVLTMFTEEFYQPTPKEQEVWKVCDALYAEKIRLTYHSIGERLVAWGLKRGSNTDLCRYLASWKKHHYPTLGEKTENSSVKKPSSPNTTEYNVANTSLVQSVLSQFQERLDNLSFEQKRFSRMLQKQFPESAGNVPNLVPLLIDMIQKQQAREAHYLKALEHAREIQNLLKREIERLREDVGASDVENRA